MNTFKKTLLCFIIMILIFIFAVATINFIVVYSYKTRIHSSAYSDISADCIIVLGAGVRPDGTPSLMLAERLDMAVELYKNGVCDKLLMSGDHGTKEYDEVNIMKDYVVQKGVPNSAVYLDHAGFSTYDSMYRAKAIFGIERPIIVTQEYHLFRAVYVANALGMEANGIKCNKRIFYGRYMREIREVAARCKDFITCIFKPLPKFLGESIPISTVSADKTYG